MYAGNNPIINLHRQDAYSTSSQKNSSYGVTIPTLTAVDYRPISIKPLSFSVGLVTPEKYDMPSWMFVYAFYAKGTLGWGYTFGDGYSLASFSAGILDTTFYLPKWFGCLPDDHLANPNIYLGIGALNVNASVGIGVSGTVEVVSGTIGMQFGDSITIGAKGYVGAGFTFDITDGLRFGGGVLLGYEIYINIDWYELFH